MKTRFDVDDLVDITHNLFRYSGFVARGMFRDSRGNVACGSTYLAGNWANAPVTLEQLRVERYLEGLPLTGKKILHVGIGSSTVATKFQRDCQWIDGITVMEEELQHAKQLGIANYGVFLMDKYSEALATLPNRYDYIVDTNLSTFTSKRSDLDAMMRRYAELLVDGGMILTDRLGMHFHEKYAFPIYDEDLIGFESRLPLRYQKIDRSLRAMVRLPAAS